MMSDFERDLHDALRRRQPPPGFAGRVLARTRELERHTQAVPWWNLSWRWASAAAMALMLVAGLPLYQEHRRQVETQKSKEQLLLALRITGSKLQLVQEKLSAIQQKKIELPLQQ